MSLPKKALLAIVAITALGAGPVHASLQDKQFSIRTGMINGSYSNPLQAGATGAEGSSNVSSDLEGGGFMTMPSLDMDLEVFGNYKTSYFARTIIGMDMSTGKMHYNYFGLGMKNYIMGTGISRMFLGKDRYVKMVPKRRMYYGYDLGFSRVSVVSFGSVLSAVSTGIDFGGHAGYTMQIGKQWGLNAQAGLSYAYGISTISASGMNMKLLFGLTYTL